MATESKRKLDISEEKLRILKEEFAVEEPVISEVGSCFNALAEAEAILRDTHLRFKQCYESVKDAVVQAAMIDSATADPAVRFETRANVISLREKMRQLREDRARAESTLRNMDGYGSYRSVIVLLLEAERKTDIDREEWQEMEADQFLTIEILRRYSEHTQLTLSSGVLHPSTIAEGDTRRCEMCGTGFPADEVITTPCGHYYHLFCLAIRVAVDPECSKAACSLPFPIPWMQTFGFPSIILSENSTEAILSSSSSEEEIAAGKVFT